MGDLDYEQEVWDVARLRDEEERSDAQGRSRYTTIALTPDGELAGHTQLAVSRHEPDRGFQWDTLVLTAHRGHRLGLALKVANLQTMTAAHPEVGTDRDLERRPERPDGEGQRGAGVRDRREPAGVAARPVSAATRERRRL